MMSHTAVVFAAALLSLTSAYPLFGRSAMHLPPQSHLAAPGAVIELEGQVAPARPTYTASAYAPKPPYTRGFYEFYNGAAYVKNVKAGNMYRIKYTCPKGIILSCNCHGLSCAKMHGVWIQTDGTCQCDYWATDSGCTENSGVDLVCENY